jgi:hypothetical protein
MINGTLPPEWGSRGSAISDAIETVQLYNNAISGSLPPDWSAMVSFNHLQLGGLPKLTGSLPPEWSEMGNLVEIDLSSADITGTIPPDWSAMSSLADLKLFRNRLTGTIPAEFVDAEFPRALNVGNNDMFVGVVYIDAVRTTFPSTWVTFPQSADLMRSGGGFDSTTEEEEYIPLGWS